MGFSIISTSLIQHHVFSSIFYNILCLRRTTFGRINLIVDKQPDKSKSFFKTSWITIHILSIETDIQEFPVCCSAKLFHNNIFVLAFMSLMLLLLSRCRMYCGEVWRERFYLLLDQLLYPGGKKISFHVCQFFLLLEIILDLHNFSVKDFYLYLCEKVSERMEKTSKTQHTPPLQIKKTIGSKPFVPSKTISTS